MGTMKYEGLDKTLEQILIRLNVLEQYVDDLQRAEDLREEVPVLRYKVLSRHHSYPALVRATKGAAALDLRASIPHEIHIDPGQHACVPTGIAVEVPLGYEAQVRARSGLAKEFKVGLTNGIGTIDSDYRGEVSVLLSNHGRVALWLRPGARIAQLVVQRVPAVLVEEVDELTDTERGAGGFGSTGVE